MRKLDKGRLRIMLNVICSVGMGLVITASILITIYSILQYSAGEGFPRIGLFAGSVVGIMLIGIIAYLVYAFFDWLFPKTEDKE